MTDDLTLGRLLGQREAFNVMAARCTAADASLLRQFREQKLYLEHAADWDEFCTKFLHTSKASANRIIRQLEEFGPAYFEVAQITRISPAVYRAIAPAVQDHRIEHDGETIALVPENQEKVAAAIASLRKAAVKPPALPPPAPDPLDDLRRHCRGLGEAFAALQGQPEQKRAVLGALTELSATLLSAAATI
jgi:hypothetical protein